MADLTQWDTQRACSTPLFLQFEDPEGAPIFDPLLDDEGSPIVDELTGFPKDDPEKPVGVMLLGGDAPEVKRYVHAQANDAMKKASKGGFRPGERVVTSQETENRATNLLSRCITEFVRVSLEGETLKPDPDTCLMFLQRFPLFREQIDKRVNDRAAYLKNSSGPSENGQRRSSATP